MKSTLDNYMNELDAFLTEASTVKFNIKETLRGQGFDRKFKDSFFKWTNIRIIKPH